MQNLSSLPRAHKRRINGAADELAHKANKENINPDQYLQQIINSNHGRVLFPDTYNKQQAGNKYKQLLSNTADLITALGPYNQNKKVLLHYLCKELPVKETAKSLDVSSSSVYSSQSSNYSSTNSNCTLLSKYPLTTRERISTVEKEAIKDVIKRYCPVKSGLDAEVHYQRISSAELFNMYCLELNNIISTVHHSSELTNIITDSTLEHNLKCFQGINIITKCYPLLLPFVDKISSFLLLPRCKTVFDKIKDELWIRRANSYDGAFDCMMCFDEPRILQQLHTALDNNKRNELQQQLNEIKEHKELNTAQRQYHQQQRKQLKSDECMITQDFTILNLYPNSNEANEIRPITCLVVILEQLVENSNFQRHYYDFICNDPLTKTNDYYYVRQAWEIMLNELKLFESFTRALFIWSDGAAKHFKQKFLWKYLAGIKEEHNKDKIEYNFFAPYHGHNLCDSQKPRINNTIQSSHQQSQNNRLMHIDPATATDREYWGPRTVSDLAELINGMNNTTCIVIESVNRHNQLKPNLQPLREGSRPFFHVNFIDSNTIRTKRKSCDDNSTAIEQHFQLVNKRIKLENKDKVEEVEPSDRVLRPRRRMVDTATEELLLDILDQCP